MIDYNYAEEIYRTVFPRGDFEEMYIRGIFEALETLIEKEEKALRYRLGDKMTYKKIALELGITIDQARTTISKAQRKLRHPSRARRMRVPDIEDGYITKLKAKNEVLNELIHGLGEVVRRAARQ